MSIRFLLIQGIGFLGTILFFLSYQCRSNKSLFRVQFFSYLCYTVHLLLLGAVTGGISYILKGRRMCCLLCILQVTTLIFTWTGWWSLLPVVANIAATIGGYTYNARKIRLVGMLINSPLWIIYDIVVGSWAGILDEIVSESSMVISILRYGWKNMDSSESET